MQIVPSLFSSFLSNSKSTLLSLERKQQQNIASSIIIIIISSSSIIIQLRIKN